MSRTTLLNLITNNALKKVLEEKEVQLIGGDLEEAPMVYKNIETVIASQTNLV